MTHTAQITFHRATCNCGQMQGIWRAESEAIGKFTIRAHECWKLHAEMAESPAVLFDYQADRKPTTAQANLF